MEKGSARIHNAVHDDAIWRQTIRYEINTAKNWKTNWGFMRDAMLENNKTVKFPAIKTEPRGSGLPSKLPLGLADENNPIVNDWLLSFHVPRIIRNQYPGQKYAVPATTSQEVGWPWGNTNDRFPNPKQYEKFGSHARGRGDVLKWFGAREALP